ncbi:hypothetical protein LX36DRAFT_256709 [Colletotrichum falcatum]|nr:hypothetical protein LX36DRAFT_256709 [Colletotrichum falcatum]
MMLAIARAPLSIVTSARAGLCLWPSRNPQSTSDEIFYSGRCEMPSASLKTSCTSHPATAEQPPRGLLVRMGECGRERDRQPRGGGSQSRSRTPGTSSPLLQIMRTASCKVLRAAPAVVMTPGHD